MRSPSQPLPASGPSFRPLDDQPRSVTVEVDGRAVQARDLDTVASLLLTLVAPDTFRTSPVTGAARAPLCMMGICFECLVEIDGQANQQACLVRVRPGMRIRRQLAEGGHN
jgi:D-hydroxyproline dehydrogenase subunit gamma